MFRSLSLNEAGYLSSLLKSQTHVVTNIHLHNLFLRKFYLGGSYKLNVFLVNHRRRVICCILISFTVIQLSELLHQFLFFDYYSLNFLIHNRFLHFSDFLLCWFNLCSFLFAFVNKLFSLFLSFFFFSRLLFLNILIFYHGPKLSA